MRLGKKQSALVLVGRQIKVRLEENREHTGNLVGIDALRFTVPVQPTLDHIYPPDCADYRKRIRYVAEFDSEYMGFSFTEHHSVQALDIANQVCEILGPGFYVDTLPRRGQDFYRYRWSIMRESHECGWVGFLSSSDHKHKKSQDNGIHVNLHGHACTFAQPGWQAKAQAFIERWHAVITRTDLALDIFDAAPDFLPNVKAQYEAGLMNVGGKMPSYNMQGRWASGDLGHSRSFYIGSKEAGKQTNVYEKGHQLFGPESGSTWVRIELRYGNKLRVIDPAILTRPESFFAGASEWHAQQLREFKEAHGIQRATAPQPIKTKPRLAVETVKAETFRNLKWLRDVAAPSISLAFRHLGDEFLNLVTDTKRPGRLERFTDDEIAACYRQAFHYRASAAHA